MWDIRASREAPEGTDRPTSAGSSVLSSAADPPRVTHVPPQAWNLLGRFLKADLPQKRALGATGLLSFCTDLDGELTTMPGACTPFLSLDCVDHVEEKVLLGLSSKSRQKGHHRWPEITQLVSGTG